MSRHALFSRSGIAGLGGAAVWIALLALTTLPAASDNQSAPRHVLTPFTPALSGTYSGICEPWVQVNDDAFGLGTGADSDYGSEEGFEAFVFNDQLYVGMEADNSLGARLWRTRPGVTIPNSQADWEEVAADANGDPFGVANRTQNDHIDSLAEFNGYLYVSTANGGSSTFGTRIFRSPTGDPGSWTDAIAAYSAGFGDVNNTNFKDMQVFDGWLCGGTQNWDWADRNEPDWAPGTQVWCTADGTAWVPKNANGFGEGANIEVWSGYVYDDALYFGAQNYGADRDDGGVDDVATLYRTADLNDTPVWVEVFRGDPGSRRVDLLGDLNGDLYISMRSRGGIVILRSPNGDPGSWTQVNTAGMDGNPQNVGAVVDSATVYNGALYVGVANVDTGFEVWRTDGNLAGGPFVDWVQVDGSGLGDANNGYTELVPFNGYLYAWTSNDVTGQQVRRSKCPLCESRVVTGSGTYTFGEVGAAIDFTTEELDSVEVCVYPGAFPVDDMADTPVKRHYQINPSPVDGAFAADLTLSYSDEELKASNVGTEATTYLQRWTGSEWVACPEGQRDRNTASNTVTCHGVTAFSTWAIAAICPSFVDPPVVDVEDIQIVAAHWRWRSTDPGWDDVQRFNLDGDGDIDITDLMQVVVAWGIQCRW